jgi:DNA-cytosine methyltransferase
MKINNVVSCFDGISGFQQALQRLRFDYKGYYSFEIDKHSIKATQHNFPNTIQLGDITKCVDLSFLKNIDILCGGSPCTNFSFAGKMKGMVTNTNIQITSFEQYIKLKNEGFKFEGQSYLFWEYVRVLREVKPKYFLLENVIMEEKWEKIISKELGVSPIKINSSLLSAQSRKRNYWTNIGMQSAGLFGYPVSIIKQPKDKGILLKHILQPESEVDEKYYLSDKMLKYFLNITQVLKESGNGFKFEPVSNDYEGKSKTISTKEVGRVENNFIKVSRDGQVKSNQNKSDCFTAGGNSGGNHSDMDLICIPCDYRSDEGIRLRDNGKSPTLTSGSKKSGTQLNSMVLQINTSKESGGKHPYQQNRVYDINGKNPALCSQLSTCGNNILHNYRIRRLTPIEVCRLQTIADDYFFKNEKQIISDTQIYKSCGNGFTVDVISYLLNYIK